METMTYVNLAVSKDETRPNLCRVYRDVTELVATDGHRLHRSNGMPETSPHYLDGYDGDFPDWRQAWPKDEPDMIIMLSGIGAYAKELKAMLALIQTYDPKNCGVRFEFKNQHLMLESKGESVTVKLNLFIGDVASGKDRAVFGLNLRYFLEALTPVLKRGNAATAFLHLYGVEEDGSTSKPITVTFVGGEAEKLSALIMPVRLYW